MTRDARWTLPERLQAPDLPPKLRTATLRYRFKLAGGEEGDLVLERGRFSLGDAKAKPDCVVECAAEEFVALFSGKHNMLTAFMRGDVRIQGTVGAAKSLHTFLRYARFEESKA